MWACEHYFSLHSGRFFNSAIEVFRLTTKEHLDGDDLDKIERLLGQLRARENELEHRLAHDSMTVDAAKALMEEVRGLLKAMDELRDAETEDRAEVSKKAVMSRVEDARRWRDFIESIRPRK